MLTSLNDEPVDSRLHMELLIRAGNEQITGNLSKP